MVDFVFTSPQLKPTVTLSPQDWVSYYDDSSKNSRVVDDLFRKPQNET